MNELEDAMLGQVAEEIAKRICACNTDIRGNLLEKVSEKLNKRTQYYTANSLLVAAEHYGVNPDT